jgi:putative spermidine/putrescine transport system permease protein
MRWHRLIRRDLPRATFTLVVLAVYVFMFLPVAVVLAMSVSPSKFLEFPPKALSIAWYRAAMTPDWIGPFKLSFILAVGAATLATLLGAVGAFAVVRHRFSGRDALLAALQSPLAVPSIVAGVAILQFFTVAGVKALLGFPALLLAHAVEAIPFVVRTVSISLLGVDRNLELAAMNLGARRWQALRKVTFPLIKPGVFAGAAFAFIISFNNVNISLFLVRPGEITLPIRIMNFLEFGVEPILAAVNVLSLAAVLLVVAVAERLGGFTRFLYGR